MRNLAVLIVIGWLLCGVLNYGISLAYWQGEYSLYAKKNYRDDVAWSVWCGLTGPVGLIVAVLCSDFVKHGLKFK